MIWYWYVAQNNEILLDLDSRYRVQTAIEKLEKARVRLEINRVYIKRSYSEDKYHAVVKIDARLSQMERSIWAWWLGSDPIRAMYNLMRIEHKVQSPDLLISPKQWEGFWRPHDYICSCKSKHKGLDLCSSCPVFQALHFKHAGVAYFPLREINIEEGLSEWTR